MTIDEKSEITGVQLNEKVLKLLNLKIVSNAV